MHRGFCLTGPTCEIPTLADMQGLALWIVLGIFISGF